MKELGSIIRKLRKQKKVTLVELSERTGVAQASLSRIETGIMTGTVESHKKIAEALGVSLAELYAGVDEREAQIAHADPMAGTVTPFQNDVNVEILTSSATYKKIMPTLVKLKPGAASKEETFERGVERFYMVLKGTVRIKVSGNDYNMKERQTLYFDASLPSSIMNIGDGAAEVFCATSPAKI